MNEATRNEIVKHNYLAAAEMSEEGNYNMIDGIINNVEKPSILEHLRQYKQQPPESDDRRKKVQSPEIEK